MSTIKAISLYQPWASYIADGRKTIETRSWYTSYRGDILICSSRKPVIKGMPCGMALCLVELYDCRPMKYADDQAACCPWRHGLFSWFLKNIRRISPPFSVRGRQGIYEVELSQAQRDLCLFNTREKKFQGA
ncbi:MAG: ASCH domain-containing protein [Sedimentisphaerales bacterium]|nr:ASCH domain-containing protein [Sedimentisphaerales bacterium]